MDIRDFLRGVDRSIRSMFGKKDTFSAEFGGEVVEGCTKMKPEDVTEDWLRKLSKARVDSGTKAISFEDAPDWKVKRLGGGAEKDVYMVLDDNKRAAVVDIRGLFEGRQGHHYESYGSIGFYDNLGDVNTELTFIEPDGSTTKAKKGINVREHIEGATLDNIGLFGNPKSERGKIAGALLTFPQSLYANWKVKRSINSFRSENTWVDSELHEENFMLELHDRPITEDRIYPVPIPQWKDGKLRLRWMGDVRVMDIAQK